MALRDAFAVRKRSVAAKDFNRRHFHRVAVLWTVISLAAVLSLLAEVVDAAQ